MALGKEALLRNRPRICHSCRAFATRSRNLYPDRRESQKLPEFPARTRFAPSPTGYLHLGSLRTALYNYLLAKATGGQFLLRIEDTDRRRTVSGAEDRLIQDLRWAGLQWDEGPIVGGPFGPYRQSERTALYQEHAQALLRKNQVYRCFCSPARLSELAQQQNHYDGSCRAIPQDESEERALQGEAHVVRLKTPPRPSEHEDIVYGTVGKQRLGSIAAGTPEGLAFEDPILLKSDGLPTYHLANVVDDHYMEITHVIRAAEWMSSTPKHLVMYHAFGWKPPKFAHVGLLQNAQQQKLSKRDIENVKLDVKQLQDDGVFPEALLNYVALHGWSHKATSDFMPLAELIKAFDLRFTKGNSIIMPEKLGFLQRKYTEKYIREGGCKFDSMIGQVCAVAEQETRDHPREDATEVKSVQERVADTLRHCHNTYRNPHQFYQAYFYFFRSLRTKDYLSEEGGSQRNVRALVHGGELTLDYRGKFLPIPAKAIVNYWLETVVQKLKGMSEHEWNELQLRELLKDTMIQVQPHPEMVNSEFTQKSLDIQLFLRWAMTAGWAGPANSIIMTILGRKLTLQRLAESSKLILK